MATNIVPFPGSAKQDDSDEFLDFATDDELDERIAAMEFFQFNMTLNDMDVPTWRRVSVPADMTLDGLSNVIVILFGWSGGHYYYFQKGKTFYDDPQLFASHDTPYPAGETHVSAKEVILSEVFADEGSSLEYTYDFGDCWSMSVTLEEKVSGADYPFALVPLCTGGAGANPPEDVGGAGGYANFCEAVGDPDHPEHEAMREWADLLEDEEWDPEDFAIEDANEIFAGIMVENAADLLVPEDPDELRNAYIDLLAESLARQASDSIVMNYMISRFEEEFEDEEFGDELWRAFAFEDDDEFGEELERELGEEDAEEEGESEEKD